MKEIEIENSVVWVSTEKDVCRRSSSSELYAFRDIDPDENYREKWFATDLSKELH